MNTKGRCDVSVICRLTDLIPVLHTFLSKQFDRFITVKSNKILSHWVLETSPSCMVEVHTGFCDIKESSFLRHERAEELRLDAQ